jgi:hypothetical protein
MCHKNLEPIDYLRQWDRAVGFPIVEGLRVVDIDDEIFFFAMVMHLGLLGVPTRHD